jgi:hypothetical protein
MKKRVLVVCLAVFGVISVNAQFNDSVHHYIRYAVTGIINKTDDTRSYLLSNALRYNLRKRNKSLNFNGSHVFGQQNRTTTNNDFSSTLDFNLAPKDSSKLYYWGLLNYDKSFSLKINGRVQTGLGLAYNFVDNSSRFINISEGVLYEWSDLKTTDSTKLTNEIFRNSLRLRYRFSFNDVVILDGTNFLQNSLSNRHDYIIKSVNTISFKLRTWLSLTTAITYNKLNLTSRENLLITFGLIAESYF